MDKQIQQVNMTKAVAAIIATKNAARKLKEAEDEQSRAEAQERYNEAKKQSDPFVQKIQRMLDKGQLRARTRTIDIDDLVEEVRFLQSLPGAKSRMNGSKDIYHPYTSHFANAYKGIPQCTYAEFVNKNSAWYLTSIYRSYANSRPSAYRDLHLTDDAKDTIVTAFEKVSEIQLIE